MEAKIRLTESDLYGIIEESVKRILRESYQDRLSHATDVIEYYLGMTEEGHSLSEEQREQLSDIIAFLKETETSGDASTTDWLNLAQQILDNDMEEGSAYDDFERAWDRHEMSEKLPKGWEKFDSEDDEPIYQDLNGNEYVKDEYGNFQMLESRQRRLTEAVDPTVKINSLIQQANDAYAQAYEEQGGYAFPLMGRDGEPYGLNGDIRLDGRGNIIIPFTSPYSGPNTEKIKVLTKAGGRVKILYGDWGTEGWKDAAKLLKKVIKDAQIGNGHFQNYDASWESYDTPEERKANKEALKAMNKKIGRKVKAGMDYV